MVINVPLLLPPMFTAEGLNRQLVKVVKVSLPLS